MFLFHGVHPMKISVPALILTLLFTALAGNLLAKNAVANFAPTNPPPSPTIYVSVNSDVEPSRLTIVAYEKTWIPVGIWGIWEASFSPFKVFIDGRLWGEIGWVADTSISVPLEDVGDGWHSVEVTSTASGPCCVDGKRVLCESAGSSGVVQFLVDTSPPRISNLAVETSIGGEAVLGFQVTDYSVSWLAYSFDGGENVTLSVDDLVESTFGPLTAWNGNLTFRGISGGSHGLKVYARDGVGQVGSSETFYFTIGAEQDVFPTTLVAIVGAIIAFVAVVSFGLVAYFLRRKRKKRSNAE